MLILSPRLRRVIGGYLVSSVGALAPPLEERTVVPSPTMADTLHPRLDGNLLLLLLLPPPPGRLVLVVGRWQTRFGGRWEVSWGCGRAAPSPADLIPSSGKK